MSSAPVPRTAAPTIAVAIIATAMLMVDVSVINTALSSIAESLSSGLSGLQWIVDGYTLPLAAVVLSAGSLGDWLGRRKLFAIGLVLFTGASAACGLSGSIELLDGARAVQGVGAAILLALSLALIAQVTPQPAARVRALALYGSAIGGGLALGPLVGGALTDVLGWRAIFLANVPLGLLALALTLTRVQESHGAAARRIDWPGQLTLVAALFGLVLGLLRGNDDGWSNPLVLASLVAGGALLAAFVVIEHVSRAPMLPLELFRIRRFAGAQISVFTLSASSFALYLYLSLYLQGPLGLSPLQTGIVYLPGGVLMFAVSTATPRLSARFGAAAVAVAGLAVAAVGVVLLLLVQAGSSWTVTLPTTLLVYLGVGLYNPAVSVITLTALPPHQSGLASGTWAMFRQGGLAIGTAGLGAFVAGHDAFAGDPEGYVGALHHATVAAAVTAVCGVVLAAALLLRSRTTGTSPDRDARPAAADGSGATAVLRLSGNEPGS